MSKKVVTVEQLLENARQSEALTMQVAEAAAAAVEGKQDKIIHDGTLELKNGTFGVASPVQGVFTQSEFYALSQEQKNKGLYVVRISPEKVGEKVVWAGYDWVVVHENDDGTVVLAMARNWGERNEDIYSFTEFGFNNSYSGSALANQAQQFENSLPNDALALAVDTTVNGVTSKIFVASYEQVNGGFSYFNDNWRRMAYTSSGASWWWTSSPDEDNNYDVKCVNPGGSFGSKDSYYDVCGFRPFVTIKQSSEKLIMLINGEEIELPMTA